MSMASILEIANTEVTHTWYIFHLFLLILPANNDEVSKASDTSRVISTGGWDSTPFMTRKACQAPWKVPESLNPRIFKYTSVTLNLFLHYVHRMQTTTQGHIEIMIMLFVIHLPYCFIHMYHLLHSLSKVLSKNKIAWSYIEESLNMI